VPIPGATSSGPRVTHRGAARLGPPSPPQQAAPQAAACTLRVGLRLSFLVGGYVGPRRATARCVSLGRTRYCFVSWTNLWALKEAWAGLILRKVLATNASIQNQSTEQQRGECECLDPNLLCSILPPQTTTPPLFLERYSVL